ncbi:hypothetical protein Back11_04020 [Paenibacillus baekrokdamisoli]|uniref:Uncharacterized protein n=1 Tax=Paenibacillus baekrokdamisoli TaxID=1712516 RepID=A0A3G9IJ79_9BACL|nr:hypothetical protein [Paenibacillus baekrokdamisoli]MBB3067761.1 hypothetical protein [Paenibacillus baekrokdamisoli]BBH19057.1 hypothetical protein Back11_04020 [Paenibacillus baekrokdamisoli]
MTKQPAPSSVARSLLLHLKDSGMYQVLHGGRTEENSSSLHTLIVVTQGQAKFMTDNRELRLLPGMAFLAGPESSFQLQNEMEGVLIYFCLFFSAIGMRGLEPYVHKSELAPGLKNLMAYPLTRSLRLLELLAEEDRLLSELEDYKRQLCFQELMVLLLQYNLETKSVSGSSLVEETLIFMQTHYMERITVRQLAELAGIPHHQYSRYFNS